MKKKKVMQNKRRSWRRDVFDELRQKNPANYGAQKNALV